VIGIAVGRIPIAPAVTVAGANVVEAATAETTPHFVPSFAVQSLVLAATEVATFRRSLFVATKPEAVPPRVVAGIRIPILRIKELAGTVIDA
jgi:hypothetical protein